MLSPHFFYLGPLVKNKQKPSFYVMFNLNSSLKSVETIDPWKIGHVPPSVYCYVFDHISIIPFAAKKIQI